MTKECGNGSGQWTLSFKDINKEHIAKFLDPEYDFSQNHTRELIEILRSEPGRTIPELNVRLKAVLSTRENIPTKAQAKQLRKEKARLQKNY